MGTTATIPRAVTAPGVSGMGNRGGLNQFSPGGGNLNMQNPIVGGTASLPGMSAASTGAPPPSAATPFSGPNMNLTMHPQAMNQPVGGAVLNTPAYPQSVQAAQQAAGWTPGSTVAGTTTATAPQGVSQAPVPTGTQPSQQQMDQTKKQLIDIYGKGVGGQLAQLIDTLGSGDSAYMQAYQQMMAGVQAQGLSTIGTQLGNAGISANSSVAAIEKGSYLSQLGAQAGLQEQQLLQQETGLKANLLAGTEKSAQQEVGTSWLDTLGQVASIGGTIASDVMGMGFGGGGGGAPMISGASGQGQLPGAISGGYAGAMPASLPYNPAAISTLPF